MKRYIRSSEYKTNYRQVKNDLNLLRFLNNIASTYDAEIEIHYYGGDCFYISLVKYKDYHVSDGGNFTVEGEWYEPPFGWIMLPVPEVGQDYDYDVIENKVVEGFEELDSELKGYIKAVDYLPTAQRTVDEFCKYFSNLQFSKKHPGLTITGEAYNMMPFPAQRKFLNEDFTIAIKASFDLVDSDIDMEYDIDVVDYKELQDFKSLSQEIKKDIQKEYRKNSGKLENLVNYSLDSIFKENGFTNWEADRSGISAWDSEGNSFNITNEELDEVTQDIYEETKSKAKFKDKLERYLSMYW